MHLDELLQRRMCLFRLGEADPVVVPIEDGVVLADEYVSQNPQGPGGGGDVQTHEAAQTHGLSSLTHLGDMKENDTVRKRNSTQQHNQLDGSVCDRCSDNKQPPASAGTHRAALVWFVMTQHSVTELYCWCGSCLSVASCWRINNMSGAQSHLEDVLLSGQRVRLSANFEGDDRQRRDFVTAHHVLKHNHNTTLNTHSSFV